MEWFGALDPSLKIFWGVALISSLIFIIQTIITLFGMDASDGLNADFGGDMDNDSGGPFQFFSLRNLINFLLGYGWAGVCFFNTIQSGLWLNVVAILVGISFVVLFFVAMLQIKRLAIDNTFKMSDTIGRSSDVYLVIPGEMSGKGKIQVSVKGAYHEINAMTKGDKIPTGSKVTVVELIDDQTVLVSKL